MQYLQKSLENYFGTFNIKKTAIPEYINQNLNRSLRSYQIKALQYFINYMEADNDFEYKQARPELLFHMATGSGKTLVMAACILYLYNHGYHNFLFTVGSTNIIEKTRDNFFNLSSPKYLFVPQIMMDGRPVAIKEVENFQGANTDCINIYLKTLQGLRSDLYSIKEGSITIEDFSDEPVVIIADEAHHLNSSTKKGKRKELNIDFNDPRYNDYEDEETRDWESTVMQIFNHDNGKLPNILLEYTATMDFKDENIAEKYDNKVIFEYPLSEFCKQGFSKQVAAIVSDLDKMDRALQAVIVSQYKKKLFASIGLNEKPVVMFKSRTINESKANFADFHSMIATLTPSKIDNIRSRARDIVSDAFSWFSGHNISDENLILELQEDFSEERSLRIDGTNISTEDQRLINTLELEGNHVRTIFAVDKLNEGWDVLNLYDIVRLNEPKAAARGKISPTTNQEAQLIGRGARYLPFTDPNEPDLTKDMRKYDNDAENPLQGIETLHYHCSSRNSYIEELNKALKNIGIELQNNKKFKEVKVKMKDSFIQSDLYKKGWVYVNRRIPLSEVLDDGTIGKNVLGKKFTVSMPTGKMKTGLMFGDNQPDSVLTSNNIETRFIKLGKNVILCAINSNPAFHFDKLKKAYPSLKSVTEFITSPNYLKAVEIRITGRATQLAEYSSKEKLYVAKEVINQIEPYLLKRTRNYKGSTEFTPQDINGTFKKVITYHFSEQSPDSTEERGISMKESHRSDLRKDLSKEDWYAYEDCYGTSEEKSLITYIDGKMDVLKERYDSIYLVRNELDVHLYDFDEGRKFEPDFILFMKEKNGEGKYDNLQIFIEPKGDNLLRQDSWKEDFLLEIHDKGYLMVTNGKYNIWGLPFYNEKNRMDVFSEKFDKLIDEY